MAAAVAAAPGQDASDNLFGKGKERGGDFRLPPRFSLTTQVWMEPSQIGLGSSP